MTKCIVSKNSELLVTQSITESYPVDENKNNYFMFSNGLLFNIYRPKGNGKRPPWMFDLVHCLGFLLQNELFYIESKLDHDELHVYHPVSWVVPITNEIFYYEKTSQ